MHLEHDSTESNHACAFQKIKQAIWVKGGASSSKLSGLYEKIQGLS